MRCALVVVLFAACGDSVVPPPSAEPRSGDRLKVERYVFPDGTSQVEPGRFFDVERGEHCTPEVWSDGQTYCTPDASEAVYTSSDCTTLIGRAPEAVRDPSYFLRTYTLQEIEHPSRLFIAGARSEAPAQIWRLRAGACLGPVAPAIGDRYYALAAEVPRDELVRLAHATSAEASRLAVVGLRSDDGLHVPVELVDRALDLPCDLDLTATGGAIACIPRGTREARYYADASCRVVELEVSDGDDAPPIAWTRDAAGCLAYHEVGEATFGPLFRDVAGTCERLTGPDDAAIHRITGPFELAVLARARDHRDGRRLLGIRASEGDLTIRDPRLYDTELGTECRRAEVLPGDFRCVPITETRVSTMYADATCTAALSIAVVDTRTCVLRAPYGTRTDADVPTFHLLGAPHTAPAYLEDGDEKCVPFVPAAHQALYDAGPALSPGRLARAVLVADP